MSVSIPLIPPGARVKVRRADLPIDPRLVGRTGTVIVSTEYFPTRVDVSLDGTDEVAEFSPAELEVLEPLKLEADRQTASRRLARP